LRLPGVLFRPHLWSLAPCWQGADRVSFRWSIDRNTRSGGPRVFDRSRSWFRQNSNWIYKLHGGYVYNWRLYIDIIGWYIYHGGITNGYFYPIHGGDQPKNIAGRHYAGRWWWFWSFKSPKWWLRLAVVNVAFVNTIHLNILSQYQENLGLSKQFPIVGYSLPWSFHFI
jgi:hypothetical protein